MNLLVELPRGMAPGSLAELLALNGVSVRACAPGASTESAWCPHRATIHVTEVERAVLRAFTYCDSNQEIAAALGISPETVKTHVKHLYRKLRVGSRAFAVGRALRLGLLSLDDLMHPPQEGGYPPFGG